MRFSLIVPVFNRPDEVRELLQSLSLSDYLQGFEVVIIEDGSTITCEDIVAGFTGRLQIAYHYKQNSGPGDSRNFGMRHATGDYFIIFDSDCIIPSGYMSAVSEALHLQFTDCFGGPDAASESFTDIQKAINFTMTSFLTTGGIRGGSEKAVKFQPRSFNMGLSKRAFEATGGFGDIHPGEDPDLSIRLWQLGFTTRLIPEAYVWHKRRIDWQKFYAQVHKFGKARPILDSRYPGYAALTFWFPAFFIIGFAFSVVLWLFGIEVFIGMYIMYFLAILTASAIGNNSLKIGLLSIVAVCIQFYGYGTGFLKSFVLVRALKKAPEEVFPELFFKR